MSVYRKFVPGVPGDVKSGNATGNTILQVVEVNGVPSVPSVPGKDKIRIQDLDNDDYSSDSYNLGSLLFLTGNTGTNGDLQVVESVPGAKKTGNKFGGNREQNRDIDIERLKTEIPIADLIGQTLTVIGNGHTLTTAEHDSLKIFTNNNSWTWYSQAGRNGNSLDVTVAKSVAVLCR